MTTYFNTTMLLTNGYQSMNSWADDLEEDSWGKSIGTRAVNLPFIPGFLATGVIDGIIGSVSGFAAIVFSKNLDVWNFSMGHLDGCRKMFANSYVSLIGAINPEGKPLKQSSSALPFNRLLATLPEQPLISANGDGFISSFASDFLKSVARNCYRSENFLMQHIASRLVYVIFIPTALVTRIIDAAIAVFAVPLSLITYGKFESLNNLAYRTVQATGLFQDLFYGTAKFFNPWAGTKENA